MLDQRLSAVEIPSQRPFHDLNKHRCSVLIRARHVLHTAKNAETPFTERIRLCVIALDNVREDHGDTDIERAVEASLCQSLEILNAIPTQDYIEGLHDGLNALEHQLRTAGVITPLIETTIGVLQVRSWKTRIPDDWT